MPRRYKAGDSVLPAVFHERVAWAIGVWAFLILAVGLAWSLREPLSPLYIGFGLAYALWPLANWMRTKGVPRWATALGLIALVFGGTALGLYTVLPALAKDAMEFSKDAPQYYDKLLTRAQKLGARVGIDVPDRHEIKQEASEAVKESAAGGVAVVKTAYFKIGDIALGLMDLFLIPVFFYYFLSSLPLIKRKATELIPARHRARTLDTAHRIDKVVSGYIRGHVLVSLVLAALFGAALPLIGVRFGVLIGVVSGFLNIIPYIGQVGGFFFAALMILIDGGGMERIWMVLALYSIANYLEGTFITPKLVGHRVGLTEVQTIASLLVGAKLGGVVGIIIAIPVAGALKILLLDAIEAYQQTELYRARLRARRPAPEPA